MSFNTPEPILNGFCNWKLVDGGDWLVGWAIERLIETHRKVGTCDMANKIFMLHDANKKRIYEDWREQTHQSFATYTAMWKLLAIFFWIKYSVSAIVVYLNWPGPSVMCVYDLHGHFHSKIIYGSIFSSSVSTAAIAIPQIALYDHHLCHALFNRLLFSCDRVSFHIIEHSRTNPRFTIDGMALHYSFICLWYTSVGSNIYLLCILNRALISRRDIQMCIYLYKCQHLRGL